jgi:hypothetical protein
MINHECRSFLWHRTGVKNFMIFFSLTQLCGIKDNVYYNSLANIPKGHANPLNVWIAFL